MFDKSNTLTENLSVQKGTITGFNQEGTIQVKPLYEDTIINCFIVNNSKHGLPQFTIDDQVLFTKDSKDGTGYILGIVERYIPVKKEEHEDTQKDRMQKTEIEPLRKPEIAVVDGKRVRIEADSEISLKCGKGSITINKQGKIVILGTDLISRSRGLNRIKGAAVNIN